MSNKNELFFARKKEDVILPTKRTEDCGYDIYAYFEDDCMIIEPHQTKMIPTGLYTAMSDEWAGIIKDRGSNGSVGLQTVCGVIDSGFRNEIFVAVTNTNEKPIMILKGFKKTKEYKDVIIYPYSKAIAQMMIVAVPKMEVIELSVEELQAISSERGLGMLGSSNK